MALTLPSVPVDTRIQRALDILLAAEGRTCSVREMAIRLNLSSSRLRNLFRREMGMTLHAFMKAQRRLRACELLETTFLSVKEIAAMVGAGDLSHFVRDFKRALKMTPTEYRIDRIRSRQIGQQTVTTANESGLNATSE
jgi:AraC-like DNA-binding protein